MQTFFQNAEQLIFRIIFKIECLGKIKKTDRAQAPDQRINPCFNGIQSNIHGHKKTQLEAVLILVLMEYNQTQLKKTTAPTTLCLNPCSNGIQSNLKEALVQSCLRSVLILVLMEYNQTSREVNGLRQDTVS